MDKPMDCKGVREVLPLYVDEGCDTAEAAAVKGHLDGCADCRGAVQRAAAVRGTIQRLPSLQAPEAIWAAIEMQIGAGSPGAASAARSNLPRRFRLAWLRPKYFAVAAATLLGIGIGYVIGRPPTPLPTNPPTTLQVVDVPAPQGLEVALLLAEHGRTGDAPGLSSDLAMFTSFTSGGEKR